MKSRLIRAYAISITIIAAILLLVVIFLAAKPGRAENAETKPASEQITMNDQGESSDPLETATDHMDNFQIPENSADNINNVSGIVKWDLYNSDAESITKAWKTMLEQLHIDADIAFLGDSITIRGDLQPYFEGLKVVNLGCGGDTIRGVYNRADMLSCVNAEKVVVLCGVNMLRDDNVDFCKVEYAGLLNAIMEYSPGSQVYVCSILPMNKEWQDWYCNYKTTENFNAIIKELAEKRGMTYVDLYSGFVYENEIWPEYTVDGLHLSTAGYDKWMEILYYYMF